MSSETPFDYDAWAHELRDRLILHGIAYRQYDALDEADVLPFQDGLPGTAADAARLSAVNALADLTRAIGSLPVFAADLSGSGLKPLQDLAAAVAGLHFGHPDALLETRKLPRELRPAEHRGNFRKGQRQAMACFVVELLARSGSQQPGKDAATLLGRHGLKGRKRVDGLLPPISPKTLEKWADEIAGEEIEGQRREFLKELRTSSAEISPHQARLLANHYSEKIMSI